MFIKYGVDITYFPNQDNFKSESSVYNSYNKNIIKN